MDLFLNSLGEQRQEDGEFEGSLDYMGTHPQESFFHPFRQDTSSCVFLLALSCISGSLHMRTEWATFSLPSTRLLTVSLGSTHCTPCLSGRILIQPHTCRCLWRSDWHLSFSFSILTAQFSILVALAPRLPSSLRRRHLFLGPQVYRHHS